MSDLNPIIQSSQNDTNTKNLALVWGLINYFGTHISKQTVKELSSSCANLSAIECSEYLQKYFSSHEDTKDILNALAELHSLFVEKQTSSDSGLDKQFKSYILYGQGTESEVFAFIAKLVNTILYLR